MEMPHSLVSLIAGLDIRKIFTLASVASDCHFYTRQKKFTRASVESILTVVKTRLNIKENIEMLFLAAVFPYLMNLLHLTKQIILYNVGIYLKVYIVQRCVLGHNKKKWLRPLEMCCVPNAIGASQNHLKGSVKLLCRNQLTWL